MAYLTPPVSFCSMLRYIGYQETPEDRVGLYCHVWVDPACPADPPVKETPMSGPASAAIPVPPAALAVPAPAAPNDVIARLQQAFARKAEEEARVPLAAIESVQTDLSAYASSIRQLAEERALAAMLAAVGEPAPAQADLTEVQSKLRTSLAALLDLVGGPFDLGGDAEPAPASNTFEASSDRQSGVGLIATVPAEPAPEPDTPAFDPEDVRAVIERVQGLASGKWKAHPLLRLHPLLQCYVAEVRYWQEQMPSSSHLHWQLGQSIKVLAAIKYESGVKDFIHGLAADHRADWLRVTHEAHARVWKFDNDAAKVIVPRKSGSSPSKNARATESGAAESGATEVLVLPDWPHLRGLVQRKPLVLVGGIPVPNKIASISDRFGLNVEWVQVYRDKGDAAAIARVSNGTVAAVVILEKFLGHKTSEALVGVCKAQGIPFAFGASAGVSSLERAFKLIDTKSAA